MYADGSILTAELALYTAVGFVRFVGESAPLTQQAALSMQGVTYRIEGATHVSLVDRRERADQTRTVIASVVETAEVSLSDNTVRNIVLGCSE
jgi:hypothetical protein